MWGSSRLQEFKCLDARSHRGRKQERSSVQNWMSASDIGRKFIRISGCQARGRPSGSLHRGCPCHSALRRLIPPPRRTGRSCWRRLLLLGEPPPSSKSGQAQSSAIGGLRETPLGRPRSKRPWALMGTIFFRRHKNANTASRVHSPRMPRPGPPDLRLSPYSERSPRFIADGFYEVLAQGLP